MQRSVSYGELADLDAMFDEQVLAMGIQFEVLLLAVERGCLNWEKEC